MPTVGNVGGFPGNARRSGGFTPGGVYQGPYGQTGFADVSAATTGPTRIVPPPAPPISTLTDDFTTQDTARWTNWATGPSIVSGRLNVACTSAYANVTTVNQYNLRDSSASVEVLQIPNLGNGSTSAYLQAYSDPNNGVGIYWEGGTLHAYYTVAGTRNEVPVTYNSTAHRIWRIRESGGTLYWEGSSTGVAWTSLRPSVATPIDLSSVVVALMSGYYGTETTPGTAIFDNFNATYADPPPAPRTLYVDPAGSDANDGFTTATAWATVAKVTNTLLYPGDVVYFKRGGTWTGNLVVAGSGTTTQPVTITSYGAGALPIISGGGSNGVAGTLRPCEVYGSFVILDGLELRGASDVGVFVNGPDCTVQNCTVRWGSYGIEQSTQAARLDILHNTIIDVNIGMIGAGANDDTGAQAVLLYGDSAEVAYNTISGSSYISPDYGVDGSAIEIYNATNSVVHHNTASECPVFAEIGGSLADNNAFYDNVFTSSVAGANGFTVHGANYVDNSVNPYGPVMGTRVYHNTVVLTNSVTAGVGIWLSPNGEVDCQNNIFSVAGGSNMAMLYPTNRVITEAGNVFWNTSGNTSNYVMPAGTIDATSTIADPLFVTPPTDLRLQVGSPALDRGQDTGLPTDLLGNPRNSGLAPDSGAYEGAVSPLAETLVDDFTTQDSTRWTADPGVTVSGGAVNITLSGSYPAYISTGTYSLLGSWAMTTMRTPPTFVSDFSSEAWLNVFVGGGAASGNHLGFSILISGGIQRLYLRELVAFVSSDTQVNYDPATMVYWRIRADISGNVYWETSPDAVTWTVQRTKATTLDLSAVRLGVRAGYWGTVPNAGTASFESFNTTAPTAFTATAGLGGTGSLTATTSVATVQAATLSGAGSLTATAGANTSAPAALNGSGSLTTPSLTPKFTIPAALSGSGTLTATQTAAATTTASLTGSGSLTATSTRLGITTAALSGSGALTAAQVPTATTPATLTGSGALTAAQLLKLATTAALSGSGALATTAVTPAVPVSAAFTGTGTLAAFAGRTGVPVPAYFDPTTLPEQWDALLANHAGVPFIVVDPSTGPGVSVNANYAARIAQVRAAGVKVVGYVNTDYGNRAGVDVDADIDTWHSLYPSIDGVFFDLTDGATASLPYFQARAAKVRSYGSGQMVVTNPGWWPTDEGHIALADTVLVFENNYSTLLSTPEAWYPSYTMSGTYPASRFWWVFYAADQTQAQEVLRRARAWRIGYVYVTDDATPYDALPTYWPDFLTGAAAPSALPSAGTAAADLSGSGTLAATNGTVAATTPAALSGTGALASTAQVPRATTAADLTGSGFMSAAGSAPALATTAALSGSGALSASASTLTTTASASLTGTGALAASAAPAAKTAATLAGSGALTGAQTPAATTAAPLAGSGSLGTSQALSAATPAVLSGTGTLAAGSGAAYARTIALAGAGALTTTTAPAWVALAAFTGSGAVAATQTPTAATTAALTGAGALTATQTPSITRQAALAGSGTLSATTAGAGTATAALSGAGTLTATTTPTATTAIQLSGNGALTGSSNPAFTSTAALAGSGALSATTTPAVARPAALTGSGTLSATASTSNAVTAAMSGSGALSAATTAVTRTASAALTGTGALSTAQAPTLTTTAPASSDGTLAATVTTARTTGADSTGSGALVATAGSGRAVTVALDGSGALTATTTPRAVDTAPLTGTGVPAAAATAARSVSAALGSAGTLAAITVADLETAAHLTGLSTLAAAGITGRVIPANLSGVGTLSATTAAHGAARDITFTGHPLPRTWNGAALPRSSSIRATPLSRTGI